MRAIAVLAAVLLAAPAAADEAEWRDRALALANQSREAEGLAPLEPDDRLTAAAETHAEDMRVRDYYAHVSPDGESVRDRYLAAGGDAAHLVAENLAMCEGCPTPPGLGRIEEFHDGWMQSPEHRDNILDPGLARFGFAMAAGDGAVYAVQTFAGPGRPRGLAPGEPEQPLEPDALRERAHAALNAAREAEGHPPLDPSPDLDQAAATLAAGARAPGPEAGLRDALPDGAADWAGLGLVSGECSGCGRVPTATDIHDFLDDWLEEPALADALLDPGITHLGFALTADGDGRKAAVALGGRAR